MCANRSKFCCFQDVLADLIVEYTKEIANYDIICGVPYTALPIATIVSVKTGIPMVMRRKEAKDYGTKKLIEGSFKPGDKCLIVEDVVTSGSSVLETVKDLVDSDIKCSDAVVLLNREQGGEKILEENGVRMHSLLSMTELMDILRRENCIDDATVEKVRNYISSTKVDAAVLKENKKSK